MTRPKKIKVQYRKLGREWAWGQAYKGEDFIELDPRLKGKRHLKVLVHELLHIVLPELSETVVDKASIRIGNTLWDEKYRRVED